MIWLFLYFIITYYNLFISLHLWKLKQFKSCICSYIDKKCYLIDNLGSCIYDSLIVF